MFCPIAIRRSEASEQPSLVRDRAAEADGDEADRDQRAEDREQDADAAAARGALAPLRAARAAQQLELGRRRELAARAGSCEDAGGAKPPCAHARGGRARRARLRQRRRVLAHRDQGGLLVRAR